MCYSRGVFCLQASTDAKWMPAASKDLDAVLVDHAHCEMKAAQNALSLAVRHPENLKLVQALAAVAKEEADHFARVVSFLEKRGVPLGSPAVDPYVADLRKITSEIGASPLGLLVDRLLIACLIEARSCERFKLLLGSPALAGEPELHAFYTELFAAEARHYRTFVDLAVEASSGRREAVEARLEALAAAEATIALRLEGNASRASMHG
ncbi:MAG: tRNA isopentenyl-2-thiomethyl-A-37 hydroxylase MiaE, partial [Polyangiaceae bacterium]